MTQKNYNNILFDAGPEGKNPSWRGVVCQNGYFAKVPGNLHGLFFAFMRFPQVMWAVVLSTSVMMQVILKKNRVLRVHMQLK